MTEDEAFYKLTVKVNRLLQQSNLTAAELKLWLLLVELDPWGDKSVNVDPAWIQERLKIGRTTFYRAIQKLEQLELFSFKEGKIATVNKFGNQKRDRNPKNGTKIPKPGQDSQERDKNSKNGTTSTPKPSSSRDSTSPQTIQTYTDLLDSLSAIERESFQLFWNKKADALPKPPTMRQAWIKKHWREMWDEFKSTPQASEAKTAGKLAEVNWRDEPYYWDWLRFDNDDPAGFLEAASDENDRKRRAAFSNWSGTSGAYLELEEAERA